MTSYQHDLFAPSPQTPVSRPRAAGPAAAPQTDEVREIAARLPAGVRLGTSSWSFPGWAGIVYATPASTSALAREGLRAYAGHPLLAAVGVDRSYYAPLGEPAWRAYARAVPDGFRFLVKAPERLTLARFPRHARHGADAGRDNPRYLDAGFALDAVIAPLVAGLGPNAGPLVFQFPPQDVAAQGGVAGFPARLHAFLASLPDDVQYAVEIRNRALFNDEYLAALADTGVVHCVNQHPSMPPPAEQANRVRGQGGPLVLRWMLGDGMRYETARERFAPFDRLAAPAPRVRAEVARAVADAVADGREACVIINNKAEGCAPLSAFELAREVVRLVGA